MQTDAALCAAVTVATRFCSVRQHEQIKPGQQLKEERRKGRICDPSGRFAPRPDPKICYDGRSEHDGKPTVCLSNKIIPVHSDSFSRAKVFNRFFSKRFLTSSEKMPASS